ncbi:MAG: pitrilysin family protein [Gemmatimonadaceae bacterium]
MASSPGPLLAQQAPAAAPRVERFDRARYAIKHQRFVLANGLTLIVHEDHSVPIVGVNVWYHVGSRNETRGKTGFAHLFEHFFFNGSEHYPHGFREAMDDLGANNRNGTTNSDRTNFFEDVPVPALERTLYLEGDRMGFLANYISKEMLERERGVVQNERREGENRPYGRVDLEIVSKMFPYSHPYSWNTIGSMEDLSAASLEDVKQWYRTFYGPNNAVISLAGDITPDRALALVTKYFGDIPPGPALVRTVRWIPVLDRNIRDEMQDRVPQARIIRAYHVPTWRDAETQALSLFADVLASAKSSPLSRRLVHEKKLATDVSAGIDEQELGSVFYIDATVTEGANPADVEREMDSAVNDLLEKGPTPEELQRMKARNLAAFLRRAERLGGFGGRSDILAQSMTYGGSPDFYLERLERMATAKPSEVRDVANRWLRANHYTMIVRPFPNIAPARIAVDRAVLPSLSAAPDVAFPTVQRASLKNGLNVLLLERHSTSIVNVALAVDAGSSSDARGKTGVAALALELMTEGTKSRDAFAIENELASLGATLNTASLRDLSLVRLRATATNLGPSLRVMTDLILNPSFPPDQLALRKQLKIAEIGQEKAEPTSLAQRLVPGLIYGADHAYGKPASGTEKSVAAITRADLMQWHAEWFKPGSATLVITGDATLRAVLPLLEDAFGEWTPGTAPAKPLTTVARTTGKRIYLIDKPDAPQSVIVAAHLSEMSGQPEDLALEPVIQNFGGMATSRLNRNLRLDKHWSYGTSGLLTSVRGQRTFMVLAPVQTDKTKESMIEVEKELNDIADKRPIVGEEFASIMRNMSARLPGRFETLASLEDAAIRLVNFKLPDDYWSRYAGNVRALSEQQLQGAARKFIRPAEVIWLVVGDVKTIEPGLRALGYGDVIKVDADGVPMGN